MSLTFDFPEWKLRVEAPADQLKDEAPTGPASWEVDLEDLSGDEDELADAHQEALGLVEVAASSPDDQLPEPPEITNVSEIHSSTDIPQEVLLLVLSQLDCRDCASAMQTCQHWYSAARFSQELWLQLHHQLFCGGWHKAPHKGARLVQLPLGQHGSSSMLHLKRTLAATSVAVQLGCLRKGYEFLLDASHALWAGVQQAVRSQQEQSTAQQPPVKRARITHVDQLWQQCASSTAQVKVDERFSALAMRRMVAKLSSSHWLVTYQGFAAAVEMRADEVADGLRYSWLQRQAAAAQQQQCTAAGIAAGAAASSSALAVSQALVAPEPEVAAAAGGAGGCPAGGMWLWGQLLQQWEVYRRWLDISVARWAPLAARVEAERQLLPPRAYHEPAAGLPHLLNKGLLALRAQVLLGSQLRRPLQAAALWLHSRAMEDGEAWRRGGGLSEGQLQLLVRLRKVLTEVDVYDDVTAAAQQHTLEKFRACYGRLLLRDGRAERYGLRQRG